LKILIFSPIELPYTAGARYTGIERLCVEFSRELAKKGHDVTLLAHRDTALPNGVKLLPCEGYENGREIHAEQRAFQQYQSEFRKFDVIHDWGHLHLISRFMINLPTVNMLNNAPEHHIYPKASYNIVTWSKWGCKEFKKYYHQEARYQESIMVDPETYRPSGKRNDRFLSIGRMAEPKGNLNAVRLCRKLGLKIDVAGGRGSEVEHGQSLSDYEAEVAKECDSEDALFLGEVADEYKIELMQSCKALSYVTNHAELTSHKVQEAMFCGAPVIIPVYGGMPEIVTHGVNGFLCSNETEYSIALKNVDKLNPMSVYAEFIKKYTPDTVISGYVKLYEEVANGARW